MTLADDMRKYARLTRPSQCEPAAAVESVGHDAAIRAGAADNSAIARSRSRSMWSMSRPIRRSAAASAAFPAVPGACRQL